MRAVSLRRARENRKRAKLLKDRRGPGPTRCEARLPGCVGIAVDGHEILTSARGGSRIEMANVADLCRWCHDAITDNPDWSDRHGWTLPSHATVGDAGVAWRIRVAFQCDKSCSIDHRENFA